MEEGEVGGTSVLNKQNIYSSVSTAGRSVLPKTVKFDCWEEVGSCRLSRRLDAGGTRPFLDGSRHRTVGQILPLVQKMPQAPSTFP